MSFWINISFSVCGCELPTSQFFMSWFWHVSIPQLCGRARVRACVVRITATKAKSQIPKLPSVLRTVHPQTPISISVRFPWSKNKQIIKKWKKTDAFVNAATTTSVKRFRVCTVCAVRLYRERKISINLRLWFSVAVISSSLDWSKSERQTHAHASTSDDDAVVVFSIRFAPAQVKRMNVIKIVFPSSETKKWIKILLHIRSII